MKDNIVPLQQYRNEYQKKGIGQPYNKSLRQKREMKEALEDPLAMAFFQASFNNVAECRNSHFLALLRKEMKK